MNQRESINRFMKRGFNEPPPYATWIIHRHNYVKWIMAIS